MLEERVHVCCPWGLGVPACPTGDRKLLRDSMDHKEACGQSYGEVAEMGTEPAGHAGGSGVK